MIPHDAYPVEPWQVRETRLDLDRLAQSESLFALSNGHIGLRGNLDEGEPYGLPGTYLNSFYECRPLPYAEAGFGYPEAGQTMIDVTNGKILRLLVDDEPFDVRYGQLLDHERVLDMQAGTLQRRARWESPAGKKVEVRSTRLVSLTQRSVAAIEYVVQALDEFALITVQSELVANEDQPRTSRDPRVAAVLTNPLEPVHHETTDQGAILGHRTRLSELAMTAAMDHEIDVPGRVEAHTDAADDWARTTVICGLRPGQELRIVKYLAYGWSSLRSRPALRDQAAAAIAGARYRGWQGLLDAQRDFLDDYWDSADVAMAFERYRIVTGDDSLEKECGLAVLVETARMWRSLGHHDRHGIWHLDGVTGPDEYTAIVRDNVFTNLMAAGNLRAAAAACARDPEAARQMGVSTEEMAAWRDAADAAHIPYDEDLGVHEQCDGFTTLTEWQFTENTTYPLLMNEPYVRLYPAQVCKQADLILAMHWQGHAFTAEQKARNVDYYERRTTRDSSLSACTQAVLCAEVGHLELAHDYTYEAATVDLRDLHANTRDGLHMA
ncbi:MAG: hypothetical protein ACXVJ3_20290, partial [Ilumatobacteraceae bacterium]